MDFAPFADHWRPIIEAELDRRLPPADVMPTRLHQAMRYALLGGGKRLRPVLALACCQAVGGDPHVALTLACALEAVHAYSLVHDDLPAMDDDDLRRGRPTCHRQFDEATAILAGDALNTLAFAWASEPVPGVAPQAQLRVVHQLAMDAGAPGMVGGQMLDLLAENQSLSLPELQNIHIHKTGALIRSACMGGAILGGGDSDAVRHIKRYGEAIGLAFQIMDDVLDETGDTHTLGKTAGADRARGKTTYPLLLGLPQARQEAAMLIHETALPNLTPFGPAAQPLAGLARFILTRNH
ncbi:MAG: polyprenyl synthetase family protein [Magnetococcus sp. WYHC-3]